MNKQLNNILNEGNYDNMRSYKQQPYRRHKVHLDGYDVAYILTAFDIDERLQRQAV